MEARLSILAYRPARAARTRHLDRMYLTRMIRPRLIGSAVMVSRAHAVERVVRAVVSLGPSAFRHITSQMIALLPHASLSRSMLPSQAQRVRILKARHISEVTIRQTCA